MKFIDLFCGIGGFHQALSNIGFECVFASDIDEKCKKVYEINYKIKPEGDICKININKIPKFDILCAGFPCQPFSKAGFQRGFEDSRGNLFFEICKIIKYHCPKYLLMENVRNLASHDDGNTWKTIKKCLDKLGYNTYENPVILNPLHFQIPQNRERVIIMCKRKDLDSLPVLPFICNNPKKFLKTNISQFIETNTSSSYSITGKLKETEKIWDQFIKIIKQNQLEVPKFPIWTDWWDKDEYLNEKEMKIYEKYKDWIDKNRNFYYKYKSLMHPWLIRSRTCPSWIGAVRKFEWQAKEDITGINQVLWSARSSGIRIKNLDYVPTLVAMNTTPVYGPESRKLTPIELLKLQSFPENFKFQEKDIYKQLGNSVNVKVIEQCAKFLILNDNLF